MSQFIEALVASDLVHAPEATSGGRSRCSNCGLEWNADGSVSAYGRGEQCLVSRRAFLRWRAREVKVKP